MGFMDAVKTCFKRYVDFQGRAGRAEFWYFQLFILLLYVVVMAIVGAGMAMQSIAVILLAYIPILAVLLPSLAVMIRRLHDTDRSGWWILIGIIPLIGLIVLLVFIIPRGTVGPNRWGPETAASASLGPAA